MSTTYAQHQSTAQKKDANTAASVVDSSSQGESLQRKADMANNNVIQCYPMTPNFTQNHTYKGDINEDIVQEKLRSRKTKEPYITKNSVLNKDAKDVLFQFSEDLHDKQKRKWQPIREVPCMTACDSGPVRSEYVSVWITENGWLGHVDENDASSPGGAMGNYRPNHGKPGTYGNIEEILNSYESPTVPQKTVDPNKKKVEKLQSGLESEFFGCIADDGYFVIEGSPIFYEMNKIIKFFYDFNKDEKKQLYLNFTEKDTDELCAVFKEKLLDKWSSFFEDSLKNYYIPSELDGIYELDETTSVDLTCVWSFYKDTLKECGKTL